MFGLNSKGNPQVNSSDLTSLKTGNRGSAKLPEEVAEYLIKALGQPAALTDELTEWWVRPEVENERINVLIPALRNHIAALSISDRAWSLIETYCATGMPTAIRSKNALNAKSKLYGGDPGLALTTLESVALGHAFNRQVVEQICNAVSTSTLPYLGLTLHADHHGQGLSIALAQAVRDLSALPETEVYSIIGDAETSRSFLQSLDTTQVGTANAWLQAKSECADRVVLVVDDVIDLDPTVTRNLYEFLCAMSEREAQNLVPRLAIILGAFGTDSMCFTEEVRPLELTDKDRNSCYLSMADGAEPLIVGHLEGLSVLLREHPVARQIGNDAQAFIDFLLEYGGALATEHWLAKIDEGETGATSPLIMTATAELLELPLPAAVAMKATQPAGLNWKNALEMVASIHSLVWIDGKNPGVALACPRRAKSILRRAKQFSEDQTADAFSRLLVKAFSVYMNGEPGALESLEFARHLVQRLGKRELYQFEGKPEIAQSVMARYIEMITNKLAPHWTHSVKARWAGTIAPFVRSKKLEQDYEVVSRQAWAKFVDAMSTDWMLAIETGVEPIKAETALSVMRAVRALRIARYRVPNAAALADRLNGILTPERLTDLIDRQLAGNTSNDVHRANELVHGWCRFQEARSRASWDADLSGWVFSVLELFMERFAHHQAQMDAAALIECARYIWLDKDDETKHRDALDMRLELLGEADAFLTEFSFAAGTWDARYRKEIAELRG